MWDYNSHLDYNSRLDFRDSSLTATEMAKTVKELSVVINDLQTKFDTELKGFKESLKAATSPEPLAVNHNLEDIANKFVTFEASIMKQVADLKRSIRNIEQRVDKIELSIDRSEQGVNNRKLIVHGIKEIDSENLFHEVISMFQTKLEITVNKQDISDCRRLGKKRHDKVRPIVVDFSVKWIRDEIFVNKAKLKGSGIMCTELLTKRRLELFKKCRGKYGQRCWTVNGAIIVVLADGGRKVISTEADLV